MKRRWKIVIGVVVTLAILLVINAVISGSQTKEAEVTSEGGQILELSRGAVQVTDSGEPTGVNPGQPIVLLHCYTCSLHWFDKIEPLLAERHRVIRVDLLGFGGSEKPESGYEIPAQAQVVAEAMNPLGVQGALVAGNSMGGSVAASLAEQASQLVEPGGGHRHRSQHRGLRPGPAAHRPAHLCPGPGPGGLARGARLHGPRRVRIVVRARLRHGERIQRPRPGARRLQRDDLHLVRRAALRKRRVHAGTAARRALQAHPGAPAGDLRRGGPDHRRRRGGRRVLGRAGRADRDRRRSRPRAAGRGPRGGRGAARGVLGQSACAEAQRPPCSPNRQGGQQSKNRQRSGAPRDGGQAKREPRQEGRRKKNN